MKNLDKIMKENSITGVMLSDASASVEMPKYEAHLGTVHISKLRNGANYTHKTMKKVIDALNVLLPKVVTEQDLIR